MITFSNYKVSYLIADKKLEEAYMNSLKIIDSRGVFAKRENHDRLIVCCYDPKNESISYEMNTEELFNG